MTEALIAVIVALTVAVLVQALTLFIAIPFLFWRCFRFDVRLDENTGELQKQIDTLDETLAGLLGGIGVPAESKEK